MTYIGNEIMARQRAEERALKAATRFEVEIELASRMLEDDPDDEASWDFEATGVWRFQTEKEARKFLAGTEVAAEEARTEVPGPYAQAWGTTHYEGSEYGAFAFSRVTGFRRIVDMLQYESDNKPVPEDYLP